MQSRVFFGFGPPSLGMISALVVDKLGDGKCTRCRGTGKIKEKFIEDCKTCEKGKCPHCQGSRVLTGIRDCEECQDGKCYPCGGVGLMDYRARCKVCTGTGFAPKPFPDCPTCHKQFLKTCPECMGKKQLRTVKDCPHCERGKCTSCGGEGNYANHPTCIDCHGTGKRTPFIDVGSTCPGMRTSVYTKKTEKCWMKLFFSKYPKVYTCAICKVEKSEPQQYCHCPNLSECNFNLPCCLECVQKIAVEEVACTTCEGDGDMTKYRTCRKCKGDGRCIRCDGKGLFGVMKTCSCDSGHCGGCNKKSFDIMFCEDGDKCTPRGWCADCRENRQKCETCPGDGLMPQPRCRKCKGSGKCKNCTGVGECDKERPCKKCKNGKCKECKGYSVLTGWHSGDCPDCDGKGPCPKCHGKKKLEETTKPGPFNRLCYADDCSRNLKGDECPAGCWQPPKSCPWKYGCPACIRGRGAAPRPTNYGSPKGSPGGLGASVGSPGGLGSSVGRGSAAGGLGASVGRGSAAGGLGASVGRGSAAARSSSRGATPQP